MAAKKPKAKLGSGARFKTVEASAAASGARDPAAVAAAAGRKKYGAAKMAKLSAAGRRKSSRDSRVAAVQQTAGLASAADLLALIDQANDVDRCREHPAWLLDRVKCVDATTGEQFVFQLVDPAAPWYWQRELLDDWLANEKNIDLKARQLGVTWLAAGFALWTALYRPSTRSLVISINENEASKVVNRTWDMLQSLPPHLWNGAAVTAPAKGVRPNLEIELQHSDHPTPSVILGLPSTKKAGHGETAALVILDEYARHEYARESWKAVVPTLSGGGKLVAISTGNGVSSEVAGQSVGNFFHHLWTNADAYGVAKRFLRWDLHPDRDEAWYRRVAMAIPATDRAEQFPKTELEAFILTGSPYFDVEALGWYRENATVEPMYRMRFEKKSYDTARIVKTGDGWVSVYREPKGDTDYALAADVATGRGADYSAAYVVSLADMSVAASFHGKLDMDLYAYQLHYLGRFFNTAWLAVEMGGAYGEPVVLSLRDGRDGRPAYPRLYLHRQLDRGDQPQAKPYGFPMTIKSRPAVIANIAEVLRDRLVPDLDAGLLSELQTFVYRTTNPSPRAQEGCNDDRVMAFGIALELYRQRGHHKGRQERYENRPPRRRRTTSYPWEYAAS